MKVNSKMRKYIDSVEIMGSVINLSTNLNMVESIVFPKFLDWDDCVLLIQEQNYELPTRFTPNQFVLDRTAFEANYNHVHLNDIFNEATSPDAILSIGTKILETWAAILYKRYSGLRKFILTLSYDGEEVVLRFYMNRENEVPWLNISELESYADGLMILEI